MPVGKQRRSLHSVDTQPISYVNVRRLAAHRDIDGLIDALRHSDPIVRKEAASALRQLGAVRAVPALLTALALERHWQVVASLSIALNSLQQASTPDDLAAQRDIPALIALLDSPNDADVRAAARLLGELGDRRAVEPLLAAFSRATTPDDVRYVIVEALLALKSAPDVLALAGALRHPDWQVRRRAAAVLGQIEARWAVPGLAAALEDDDPRVRQVAEAALRRINSPLARQALIGGGGTRRLIPGAPRPAPDEDDPLNLD